MPKKLTIEEAKKLSPKVLLMIINRAKKFLKNNNVVKEMCKEYDVDTDVLDLIPVRFGDIDVSAQTSHGIVILNYKLLCDGNFFDNIHYCVHEFLHVLQQCYGDKPTQGADDGDYLHNKFEQDGFKKQVEFIDDMHGKEEAEDYVEHLLDHHDKDGKERDKLKDIIMEEVDG